MPKVFTYFGFIIYIFTDDHLPIHVHAMIENREGKFILDYFEGILTILDGHVNGKKHLKAREITEMRKFVLLHADKIKEQWEAIHIYKKKITCIEVKEKV